MKQQLRAATGEFSADGVWGRGTFADAQGPLSTTTCAPQRAELRPVEESASSSVRMDRHELEQYRVRLTQFATRLLRNRAAAEDAAQETLLAALQSEARFSGRSSLKTWLFGILKHKIADTFRLSSRARTFDLDHDFALLDDPAAVFTENGEWRKPPSHWDDPEAALTQRRFFELLERCIDSLPKNAAQVFTMREVLDMDVRHAKSPVAVGWGLPSSSASSSVTEPTAGAAA